MPFDGAPSPKIEARLHLIEALRNEVPRFKWNFGSWYSEHHCGSVGCACGLAQHIGIVKDLWSAADENVAISTIVARAIGINARTAKGIFDPDDLRRTYGVDDHEEVTPQMVADKLEKLPL